MTLAILLSVATACRQNRSTATRNQDGLINIVTTIFPAYDFVRQIAGDRVNLTMLLSPGAESHSFEPSPRDIITIMSSDIFIYTGESEQWIERILLSMNTDEMTIFAMMNVVGLVRKEIVDEPCHECDDQDCAHDHGHEHSHDHGHGHGHGHSHGHGHAHGYGYAYGHAHSHGHEVHTCALFDEHVWTSPGNAILIVRAITELLSEADPNNAAFFQQNAAAYIKELQQLDAAFSEVVANAKRRTIVFADRFPFRHFVDAYSLTHYAAFTGCSTETEPSAGTVAFLINKIRTEQIPVVFHIELSNERMADAISAETGAKKRLLHSVHNVSRRDFEAGLGYLELMRRNVETLREALN